MKWGMLFMARHLGRNVTLVTIESSPHPRCLHEPDARPLIEATEPLTPQDRMLVEEDPPYYSGWAGGDRSLPWAVEIRDSSGSRLWILRRHY